MTSPAHPLFTRTPEEFADHRLHFPPVATNHSLIRANVHSARYLTPTLLRIVLQAPEFHELSLTGPDEFFGLLMPQANQPFTSPEDYTGQKIEGLNIRAAVADMPEDVRPDLRWYTVRHLDRAQGLLTFDVATHGVTAETITAATGPGLAWCLRTAPGDPAGIWTCQGLWHRGKSRQVLIADPSALPSVRAILEFTAAFAPEQLFQLHVVSLTSGPEDSEPELLEQWVQQVASITELNAPANSFAVAAKAHMETQHYDVDYLWVAGEGDLCKVVRAHAIKQWGMPKGAVQWCPYWFIGKARP
ncbi:siderophore-interacting protein [Corynebacterium suicordis]